MLHSNAFIVYSRNRPDAPRSLPPDFPPPPARLPHPSLLLLLLLLPRILPSTTACRPFSVVVVSPSIQRSIPGNGMRSACGHGPEVQLESHCSPQCFQRAPVVEDSARDQYHNMQGRGQGGWGVWVGGWGVGGGW